MTTEPLPPCGSRDPYAFGKMPAYRKDGNPRKRNRYPAPCHYCGTPLQPGEGVIFKQGENGWGTCCADGGPT